MTSLPSHSRRVFLLIALAAISAALVPLHPLRADLPLRRMANLIIEDKGTQVVATCHFYYSILPQQFDLQGQAISLQRSDAHLLEQNLSTITRYAFELKIDGQVVRPTVLQLTLYPNNSCLMVLSFPGHAGGRVELSAPILPYFPSGYVMNVRISSSTGARGGFFGSAFPPVIDFVQGRNNTPAPAKAPFFSRDFVAELGIAWVNYNWILICAVLLFMGQPRQMAVLIISIIVGWILLCFASVAFNFKFHHKIPEIVLALPTVLLCVISIKYRDRALLFTLVTVAAGLLNACYDIQQIPLSNPDQATNALAGLALGFVGGIALVLVALVPLGWECRKYPGFQEHWAPKIAWAIAGLALFLPLQKWLFG